VGGDGPDMSWLGTVKPKSYSYGPISDVAELGARGINWLTQQLPESIRPAPREPQPMFQPTNLPLIGQPSATGMASSLYQTGKGAVTLPGDVYAGRVDPLSEEGIQRATDLASLTPLSSLPSVAQRAGTPALTSTGIKDTASAAYDAVRAHTQDIPLGAPAKLDMMEKLTGIPSKTAKTTNPYSESLANNVRTTLDQAGTREMVAPETHALLDKIAKAKDASDLVNARERLGQIIREGSGKDVAAASIARKIVNDALDELAPGTSSVLANADRNYAIAGRSEQFDTRVSRAELRAEQRGSGGNVGNAIRQAIEPLTMPDAKFVSPEVLTAAQNVTQPGWMVNALRPLSIFDPTRHKLSLFGQASTLPLTFMAGGIFPAAGQAALGGVGYGARAMYDRILKNRAAQVTQAIRAEAPATMAQPGYQAAGPTAMPLRQPPPMLPFALAPRQQQQQQQIPYF